MSWGQVIVGGLFWPLTTRTVKVHWLNPHGLVATQVTVVIPTGKQLPEAGEHPMRVPLPTTGNAYVTGAQFEQVVAVMSAGHWMVGGRVLGSTRTKNWQVALFWQRSSAVQVTSVAPH